MENGDEIIGTCHFTVMPSLTFIGSTRMQIEAVGVAGKYRGQKIGNWMFDQAISYAKLWMVLLSSSPQIKNGQKQNIFMIGKLMPAPKVYNPGGLTVMIDDFCVTSTNLWQSVGVRLIEETKAAAKVKGASQILVVCGAADLPKRKFLTDQNLSIASEWFVGGIV
jgi:hypothetical protein